MNSNERPLSVTILACVYLAVGAIGFAYHFRELLALQHDSVWVELTEFMAIVSGAFMLRGQNWARWLALAWMAFHIILSITTTALSRRTMASALLTFKKRHFALPGILTLHADQGSCSFRILRWKLSSTTHLCGLPGCGRP